MDIPELLYKIAHNEASAQELQSFATWLETLDAKAYQNLLEEYGEIIHSIRIEEPANLALWTLISEKMGETEANENKIPAVHRVHFIRRFRWVAAAAAVFIMAIAGTYFLLQTNHNPVGLSQARRFKNDVSPGHEGAILKLSDGRQILLDTVQNGAVAPGFTKTGDGLAVEGSAVEYATVIVPKAKTERVVLQDGTIVWLNAGSTLTFPTAFSGSTREVSMTGEVYFEVAKNEAKHFFVQTKTDRIEVKGTHFNINAYGDVKTTLLEGSVQIGNTTLKPGEQYIYGKITQPDTEEVMAWKNGMFLFNNTGITEIMAQVERWYDVQIRYEGDNNKLYFSGDVERTANVSVLLKKLELTRSVEFTIDGRTITVRPTN